MRHVLLLSVLMLGVAWAAAQSSPSSSPSSSSSEQTTASPSGSGQAGSEMGAGQASPSSGSLHAVEGCLSGSDGKYTLTDKQGTTYQLTGDTSKLAEHVG